MAEINEHKSFASKFRYIYVCLIAFSTIPLLLFSSYHTDFIVRWPYILFWLLLEILSDLKPFRSIFYIRMDISLSFAVQMAMVILLDMQEAVWIVIIATLIVEILSGKQWYKILFNTGQYAISLLITGYIFNLFRLSPTTEALDILGDLPAILVSVLIYYLLNTSFVSLVITLFSDNRFIDVFLNDYKSIAAFYFSNTPISIAAALLYSEQKPYTILILVPSLIMANQTLRWYHSLHIQTVETLNVLADIIDERDTYTYAHSIRVAEYSRKIALKLKLSSSVVNEIETAGRVHDIGKITIEDSILRKPTALTKEEYKKIKEHPAIAHRLFMNLKPYKNGVSYVLYHHERIDGKGYPEGISGEDIPLGARILAVADSYDAMTTDRPYRKALSKEIAVERLKKNSGTQFDPIVVNAFIDVLKEEYGLNPENYNNSVVKELV
jgi:HD-GYP domain-containing protein (c-di-GMP phosphodiesterase class II)